MEENARKTQNTFVNVGQLLESVNPIKVMLAIGAVGMALCYSAIEYSARVFVLGFLLMIFSALGVRSVCEAKA